MPKRISSRFTRVVLRQLRQAMANIVLAAICTVGLTAAELFRPWPLKVIVDQILLDKQPPSFLAHFGTMFHQEKVLALFLVSLAIVILAIISGIFSYYQVYVTSRLANEVAYSVRRELFSHLQRLSLSFYHRAQSGELLTKIAGDTNTVKDVAADSALNLVAYLLTLLATFALMFTLNWKLALLVLVTFPVLGCNLFYLYRKAKISSRLQRKKEERIATRISEFLTSVALVRALGRERYEEQRFEAESAGYLEESIRNARIEAAATRIVEIISAISTWMVVLVGSFEVLHGRMTVGGVLIFVSYLNSLYKPVKNLAKLSTRFSKAMVSVQRISEILEIEPDIQDDRHAIDVANLKGEIVFDKVSFHYGDEKWVLRDVSYTIVPGEHVALVGPSGTGKSTLASLILRLYDPQEGAITIDGVNIKDYQRESLRRQIGIVLQDALLFGASIRENIAYGKLDAGPEEIITAARQANAHEFIAQLEHGYDTVIGERGVTLSGGQRQRIAIARALIRNAPILILDEPMTGLDGESKAKVEDALGRLMAGRTCLVITHDLRAAAEADRILALHDGRVIERERPAGIVAAGRKNGERHTVAWGRDTRRGRTGQPERGRSSA